MWSTIDTLGGYIDFFHTKKKKSKNLVILVTPPGLIALKDRDFRKIPPKAWAPVKYHRKVEMWTESSTLLDLSVSSVNLDRNTPRPFSYNSPHEKQA